jgi:hypothetical protein
VSRLERDEVADHTAERHWTALGGRLEPLGSTVLPSRTAVLRESRRREIIPPVPHPRVRARPHLHQPVRTRKLAAGQWFERSCQRSELRERELSYISCVWASTEHLSTDPVFTPLLAARGCSACNDRAQLVLITEHCEYGRWCKCFGWVDSLGSGRFHMRSHELIFVFFSFSKQI